MSYSPKPCACCAGVNFHVLPGVQLEVSQACVVFGMRASAPLKGAGRQWTLTVVVCTQCGHTEMFSANTADVAAQITGAYVATSAGR